MGGEWTEIQRGLKQRMQHMEAGLIGFVAFLSAALLTNYLVGQLQRLRQPG